MKERIIISGIQTNNLKNITVSIYKNAINLLLGPSGSGKTSLAYNTIAQIGLNELGSMYSDGINEPEYKVESYSNMVVTVPIKQLNTNNNVRSTVGTYFSISPCLAIIYSTLLKMPYDYFVLNKSENVCPSCLGLGYTKKLNHYKIIDYGQTIEDVPVRCWKKNKDFYRQILQLYCSDMSIPVNTKFRWLADKQKEAILSGVSEKKYSIKYKVTNHFSSRTTQYYGPMTDTAMLKNFSPSAEFYSETLCERCMGEKYETKHRKYKACGYSIGELLLLPFDSLLQWINTINSEYNCDNVKFSLYQIESFARKSLELKLGHIFLNRTIPSLSGGELQRLRLIKVFNSQLTDLLLVLDEPIAGLSSKEKDVVYENIIRLKKKHTLLIVDHHEAFIKNAANVIALGESGGHKGGSLIDAGQYIERQRSLLPYDVPGRGQLKRLTTTNSVYQYKGFNINIALGKLNLILGASGVGKSTLLREYFPQVFDDYLYINQKPISGNIRSTVATNIGLSTLTAQLFTKQFKQNKSFFSNLSGAEGMCLTCSGTGILIFGSDVQSQIVLDCKDCKGTGFSNKLSEYVINGKNILDIWQMSVEEGIAFFRPLDKRVCATLETAQRLLLGHLQIGEKVKNLSGGENLRIKLMAALSARSKIIGIDEPFKGLNNEEIHFIVLSFDELAQKGKTVIVADHEESALRYFSNRIVLINNEGILTEEDINL